MYWPILSNNQHLNFERLGHDQLLQSNALPPEVRGGFQGLVAHVHYYLVSRGTVISDQR